MSQFTINNTQFTEAARLLLLGNSYMRYVLSGQKGPEAVDPRGRAAKFLDLFGKGGGHEAVYRRCVEAAALLSQATQPLFRGDVDGKETQALMGAVREGSSKERHALRALVHRMRAFGALPGTEIQIEGYRDFLAQNLGEASEKSLERVRYVGAARFFEGAARFHGVERKPEIIPGAIIAFETWLNLVAGDMNDTLWNSAVELYQMTVGFSRDAQVDAMYVEDDITATQSMSLQTGKGGKTIVRNDTSYLLERLGGFQRAGKLSPAGASLEALVKFFENLERVKRGDFSPVRLESRAVILVETTKNSKSGFQLNFEEALRVLVNLRGNIANDAEGYALFSRASGNYVKALNAALANLGLELHPTRAAFIKESLQVAQESWVAIEQKREGANPATVNGIVMNFLADMLGSDPICVNTNRGEEWINFLQRMADNEVTKKVGQQPSTVELEARYRAANGLPPDVLSIEPLAEDPDIPIVVEAEPTVPGRRKREE